MSDLKSTAPFALCCCNTPLVSTLEQPGAEWYCITCKKFYGFMHAREGSGENPTDEIRRRYDSALVQYEAERAEREVQKKAASWGTP